MADNRPNPHYPIGTPAELKELGMDPRKVRSCSLPDSENLGCTHFRKCRFTQWRDGVNGLQAPVNIAAEIIASPVDGGGWGQRMFPCFMWYDSGLADRAKNAVDSGEIVRVVAYEGDGKKYKEVGTRRARNQAPGDNQVETFVEELEVPKFRRPKEKYPLVAYAQAARDEVLDDVERQALADALKKNAPAVADTPAVGEGRKVKKADG